MKKLKKILSIILTCTIAFSATFISTSAISNDNIDTYTTSLVSAGEVITNLQNGSFEKPTFGGSYTQVNHSQVPNWSTSATDQKIELFKENTAYLKNLIENTELTGTKLTPPDGLQAAELNANEDSTLYQYINTSGGSCYEWSLQHRGRCGTDTMALVIGPKQNYNPTKVSRNSRDQFMQMVDWLKNNEDKSIAEKIENQQSCQQPLEYVVYSKKFAAKGTFENPSDKNFNFKQTEVFSEEWHIWIIKSNNKEWHQYGKGSKTGEASDYYKYIVPEGSNQSIFAFVSYEATDAKGQSTPEKHNTFGNLLDGITFDLFHPSQTTVNTGGTGKVTYTNNGTKIVETITPDGKNNPCNVMIDDETQLDLEIRPSYSLDTNGNYRVDGDGNKLMNTFIGAYVTVDGVRRFVRKEEFTKETDADGEVYKYNFKDVSGRVSIELFFSEIYTVTFLSNGGEKYSVKDKGSRRNVSIVDDSINVARFNEYVSGEYNAEACNWKTSDGSTAFFGWEFLNPNSDDNGVIFNSDVHISYYYDDIDPLMQLSEFLIIGTLAGTNEEMAIVTDARDGAVFNARWYFKHDVIAQTKQKDNTYINSSDGGYVTVTQSDDIYDLSDIEDYGKTFNSFKNKTVTVTATPKEGYRFEGWYVKTDDGETYINNNQSHTHPLHDSSVTLYARFEHDNYKIRFHINDPSVTLQNANDDVYVSFIPTYNDPEGNEEIRYLNEDKTIASFYDIPKVIGTGSQRKVFKGWYRNKANDNDANPIKFNSMKFVADADVYAHWIDIGKVSKAKEDNKIGISSYYGFDLFGTQIRDADKDNNYPGGTGSTPAFSTSGLRFVTSVSESLLKQIDSLSSSKPQYGYVLAKTDTAKKYAGDKADYQLEYKDKNVNGVDTTTDYKYVQNVNCTSKVGNYASGKAPALDHFNSADNTYRIYSLVVSYDTSGKSDAEIADAKKSNLVARSYIRYTDANGLLRTYYNDYTGKSKLYGGCSTSFSSVKSIIAEYYQKISK